MAGTRRSTSKIPAVVQHGTPVTAKRAGGHSTTPTTAKKSGGTVLSRILGQEAAMDARGGTPGAKERSLEKRITRLGGRP